MSVLMCTCGFSAGTKAALNKHWDKVGKAGHGPTEQTKMIFELSDRFTYFDTSGDRALDEKELGAFLKKGNPNISDAEVKMLFAAADKDHDMKVDFDEFLLQMFSDGAATETDGTETLDLRRGATNVSSEQSPISRNMSFGSALLGGGTAKSPDRKTPKMEDDRDRSHSRFDTDFSVESRSRKVTESSDTRRGSDDKKPNRRDTDPDDRGTKSLRPAPKFAPEKTPEPQLSATMPARSVKDRSPTANSEMSSNSASLGRTWSSPKGTKSPAIGHANESNRNRHQASTPVRLLVVRHGRSANKSREKGEAASTDPELSEQGFEQAEALGDKLKKDLSRIKKGCLIIASSPMKRCLLTVRPAIFKLNLNPDDCLCHGALYEFGCAGLKNRGTNVAEIAENFPEFAFTGFNDDGTWDYRGSNDRENDQEAKRRAVIIYDWIWYVAEKLSQRDSKGPKVIVLSFHQTMADLLCQLLIDGNTDDWVYGEMKYKLFNTGVTEIILEGQGTARLGTENDFSHLDKIGGPAAKNPPALARGESNDRTGRMIAKLRQEFSKLDGSGDYKLNFTEMSALLRKGKPEMSEDQMWKIFTAVDTTKDGDVDFDEFLDFLFGMQEGGVMMSTLKL